MRSIGSRRPGFTLVEMLVVTIIIGILVALLSVAAFYAMGGVKDTVLYYQEQQMTSSFQTAGFSSMPPADLRMANATDTNSAVYKWFRRNYPRYDLTTLKADIDAAGAGSFSGSGTATTVFDPAFALVFWLAGFDPDVERPLNGHAARMLGTDRKQWKYDFDTSRLVSKRYLMPSSTAVDNNGNFVPDAGEKYRAFIYYDNGSYGLAFGTFTPYRGTAAGTDYFNLDTCQIICSGRDGILGAGGAPPGTAVPYAGNDADNVTNFGGGSNMKEYIEKQKGP